MQDQSAAAVSLHSGFSFWNIKEGLFNVLSHVAGSGHAVGRQGVENGAAGEVQDVVAWIPALTACRKKSALVETDDQKKIVISQSLFFSSSSVCPIPASTRLVRSFLSPFKNSSWSAEVAWSYSDETGLTWALLVKGCSRIPRPMSTPSMCKEKQQSLKSFFRFSSHLHPLGRRGRPCLSAWTFRGSGTGTSWTFGESSLPWIFPTSCAFLRLHRDVSPSRLHLSYRPPRTKHLGSLAGSWYLHGTAGTRSSRRVKKQCAAVT